MTTTTADIEGLEGIGAMPSVQRVITVHPGISLPLRLALLDAVESVLTREGVERAWIDTSQRHDLVVLAEVEDEGAS